MFGPYEQSRNSAIKANLCLFRYGPDLSDFYAYTDHEFPITIAGVTYQPAAIDIPAIKVSGSVERPQIEVRVPPNLPLADRYLVSPPFYRVSLWIGATHLGDPSQEVKQVWLGTVMSHAVDGAEVIFTCDPVGGNLRIPGLRRNYQYGCGHVLYDQAQYSCRANKPAATVARSVLGVVSSTRLTLGSGWAAPSNEPTRYRGGMVEWLDSLFARQSRTILSIQSNEDGSAVLSLAATHDLTAGDPIDLVMGCAHNMSACSTWHNNIQNYGGFPWIPTENPNSSKNLYY